jgi:hypothetical protein
MPWRNWRVMVVVLLANYLVFSLLGAFIFPVSPITAPTHVPQATFTRSIIELQNVGTLTYDFLTPTVTATFVSTPTITPTETRTIRATTAATRAMTPATTQATPALTVVLIKPSN